MRHNRQTVHTGVDLAERIRAYPRRRTYLLPALHEVQDALGWLQGSALELVGNHLRVPRSEVYGVASSFPDFKLAEPAEDARAPEIAAVAERHRLDQVG